jgi:hypothetical protein
VEALEFGTSPILVSLLCDLKNHAIVGFALPVQRFLIINLIEQEYLLVLGYTMIFGVAFNAIYRMHQLSMSLKT